MAEASGRLRSIWPWAVGTGIAWGLALTLVAVISEPTPENKTQAASIWTAGFYTLFMGLSRPLWLPLLTSHPLRNAALLGICNATVIETEFLLFEKLFGAQGVAAHPNLLMDLLITMPWYIGMVIVFVIVQHRYRFSAATVLLLGGIYEIGGDGIAGQIAELFSGNFQLFTLQYWAMIGVMFVWAFIPVYSSMVLPPAWIIATSSRPIQKPFLTRGLAALLPFVWIPFFVIYLLVILLLLSAL